MPYLETYFHNDSMLKGIEGLQKALKLKGFEKNSDENRFMAYSGILAMRATANAVRGKKKTLKVGGDYNAFKKVQVELMQSEAFKAYVAEKTEAGIQKMLINGHGGECEEDFRKYVLEREKLPTDLPDRWMPTAKQRIEQQQKKLEGIDPGSEQAISAYAEIFRARRNVSAIRGKGASLEKPINGQTLAQQEDLSKNEAFRAFVQENPNALKQAAVTGHGGAAEDLFKEHLLKSDRIMPGTPEAYMPTAVKRTEALIEKIKNNPDDENQYIRYTELMATREAVGAVRGKKSSLEKEIPGNALKTAYEKWSACETFQSFLKENGDKARNSLASGHGGALSDEFKLHVKEMDHIPADVPADHMPTAFDHLEALQAKMNDPAYYDSSDERKFTLAVEMMATREAVEAVRGKADSLKKPLDPKKLEAAYKKWSQSKTFRDYVLNTDPKVRAEAHTAAVTGHGGALGDKFREHIAGLDKLDADIPAEFMPTARTRTEALQKKIRDNPDASPERRQLLYAELMASRSAVNSVAGKANSLDVKLDPVTLEKERNKLLTNPCFISFMNDDGLAADLRRAANTGHGGALEKQFMDYVKNRDVIEPGLSERYMPKAEERTRILQDKISKLGHTGGEDEIGLFVELMATREAVKAVRGKKASLDKVIDGEELKKAREKWNQCESFKGFVMAENETAREAAAAGHGGALMDKFQEFVKSSEILPEDLPQEAIPMADERIEAVQKQIRENAEFMEADELASWSAQILAARENVGAVRKKPDTLKAKIDPKAVNDTAEKLAHCSAFQQFVQQNQQTVKKLATSGHGGEFAEKFKQYVEEMEVLSEDLPQAYAPTAIKRIEGLQKKVKSSEFDRKSPDEKVAALAEIVATRRSVSAERNKPDTLKFKVNPATVQSEKDKLVNCSAFQDFVKKNTNAAKSAATSGHAGALEDAFKDYVLHLDHIPADVPKEFMPTAKQRTEVLQSKIKSRSFEEKSPAEQNSMYRELMATRAAVSSIRGDVKTLSPQVDAAKLDEVRSQLSANQGFEHFMETDSDVLRKAAAAGHGGALEDKFKEDLMRQSTESGLIPKKIPKRYKPTAKELQEKLRAELAADKKQFSNQYFDNAKQDYMKKIASSMYLTKLQWEAQRQGKATPELDAEEMERTVNKLVSSQAFQTMFRDPGSTRQIAGQVADRKMTDLFTSFGNNNGRLDLGQQPQPQPVLQNQQQNPVQNQQQNPVPNQQQNPVQNQQQNMNQQQNQQLNNQLLQNLNQQGLYINQHGQLVNQQGQPVNMLGQVINPQQNVNQQGQLNNNNVRPVQPVQQPAPQQLVP